MVVLLMAMRMTVSMVALMSTVLSLLFQEVHEIQKSNA
jgi:hypothetical protein